jgi:hypothetical protein
LRGCIGWKPARRSARRQCPPTWLRPANIDPNLMHRWDEDRSPTCKEPPLRLSLSGSYLACQAEHQAQRILTPGMGIDVSPP